MNAFGETQLGVIIGLAELADTEKDTPQNEKAFEALVICLQDALEENVLFGVCNSLVALANGETEVNTRGFLNGGKVISLKDIRMLRVGLQELIKRIPEEKQGEVKKAISIVQPRTVTLFSKALRGGKFYYWDDSGQVKIKNFKYFQGIPREMWPTREKDDEPKPDFRINFQTTSYIYNVLLQLELEQTQKDEQPLPASSIMERVRGAQGKKNYRRKREANFFLNQLPLRLKEMIEREISSK